MRRSESESFEERPLLEVDLDVEAKQRVLLNGVAADLNFELGYK